jgi:hypothetical protein
LVGKHTKAPIKATIPDTVTKPWSLELAGLVDGGPPSFLLKKPTTS